jgi:hypothetical protein
MFEVEGACPEGGGALAAIVKGEAEVMGEQSHAQRKP